MQYQKHIFIKTGECRDRVSIPSLLFTRLLMINETTRDRIAALAPINPEQAAPKEDTVWDALSREAYVIGGGIGDGFAANLHGKNLLERTPEFLASVGIGAGLALAQGKKGLVKVGAQVVGLSFGVGMVKDMTDPERVNGLSTAISDTWDSPANLEHNRAMVKHHAGDFVFDSTVMAAGGIIGASSVRVTRPESLQGLRSLLGRETPGTTRGSLLNSELKSAALGLTEVRTGTLGAVETRVSGNSPLAAKDNFFAPSTGRTGSLTDKNAVLGATEKGSTQLHGPKPMEPVGRDLPAYDAAPIGPMIPNKQSLKLTEDAKGRLSEIQAREQITWEFKPGKTTDWTPNNNGVEVRLQAQQFVDAFMRRDYAGALNVAVEAPVMARVELNPKSRTHEVKITAQELSKPEIVELRMNNLSKYAEFKWAQTVRDGIVDESRLEVVIPKTVVELKSGADVRLVDIVPVESNGYRRGYKMEFPNKDVNGKPLTAAQAKEIEIIRQSEPGQRMLAETAIFGFEETIVHANQHLTLGGAITSPAFAEFARNIASKSETSRAHRLSFLGMIDSNHPQRPWIMEQEVPAIAYDAGMPLSMVRHHFFFGSRHIPERTPVMNFLQMRELYGRQPHQTPFKPEVLDD